MVVQVTIAVIKEWKKMPGVSLTSHLLRVKTFIHGRLQEIPNEFLRFRYSQTLFFLLLSWVTQCGVTGLEGLTLRLGCSVSLVCVACATGSL